jgi:hypothetical protein
MSPRCLAVKTLIFPPWGKPNGNSISSVSPHSPELTPISFLAARSITAVKSEPNPDEDILRLIKERRIWEILM